MRSCAIYTLHHLQYFLRKIFLNMTVRALEFSVEIFKRSFYKSPRDQVCQSNIDFLDYWQYSRLSRTKQMETSSQLKPSTKSRGAVQRLAVWNEWEDEKNWDFRKATIWKMFVKKCARFISEWFPFIAKCSFIFSAEVPQKRSIVWQL